jgi:hypothetical protein
LNPAKVAVTELIAWGLDDYPYRDSATGDRHTEIARHVEQAKQRLSERDCYENGTALLLEETKRIGHLLTKCEQRPDLQMEYEGLDWTLGVVDLRRLLAFQRRLVFSFSVRNFSTPARDDWPGLISLAIGPPRSTEHHLVRNGLAGGDLDISLRSTNPDLQLRLPPTVRSGDVSPLSLYGGSPFFEVAMLSGRWFLRDGYHRAYRLLQDGVYCVPAVVISARTFDELGATEPWFFHGQQLFSCRPPRVLDFLDESIVLHYERAALRKVIRIRVEESFELFDETYDVHKEIEHEYRNDTR